MIPRGFWTLRELTTGAFLTGALLGIVAGYGLGERHADVEARAAMERQVESVAPVLAECKVRTVERTLALREEWALVGPTGTPVGESGADGAPGR